MIQLSLFPRTLFVMVGRMPKFGVCPKESLTIPIKVPDGKEKTIDWARETVIRNFAQDQKIDQSLVKFWGLWLSN